MAAGSNANIQTAEKEHNQSIKTRVSHLTVRLKFTPDTS